MSQVPVARKVQDGSEKKGKTYFVCRNPDFQTPGLPAAVSRLRGENFSPALGRSGRTARKVSQESLTATPIRGPGRFLKVIYPVIDDSEEDDTRELSANITDEIQRLTPSSTHSLPRRIPFSPIPNLAANSFDPSPLTQTTASAATSTTTTAMTPPSMTRKKSTPVAQSMADSQELRRSTRSIRSPPAACCADTPKTSAAALVARKTRARKKLSICQMEPEEEATTENHTSVEPSPLEPRNFVDSPFFKVPLPPKPIKGRKFVLGKLVSSSGPSGTVSRNEQSDFDILVGSCTSPDEEEEPSIPARAGRKRPSPTAEKIKVSSKRAKTTESTNELATNEEDEEEQLYDKARYVTNWVPKMKSKKLIIEGDLLDFEADNPNHYAERWITSRVIQRFKPNLVMTKGGPYVLEGILNFRIAMEYKTPQFIMTAFKNGVPENWDMYRQQWRKFNKSQRTLDEVASSTMSTCAGQSEISGFNASRQKKQSEDPLIPSLEPLNPTPSTSRSNPTPSTSRSFQNNILVTSHSSAESSKGPAAKRNHSKLPSYAAYNASVHSEKSATKSGGQKKGKLPSYAAFLKPQVQQPCDSEEEQPKKRRGRPRKNEGKSNVIPEEKANSKSHHSKDEVPSEKPNNSRHVYDDDDSDDFQPFVKKRGRPRLLSSESKPSKSVQPQKDSADKSAKKPRGRPRLTESQLNERAKQQRMPSPRKKLHDSDEDAKTRPLKHHKKQSSRQMDREEDVDGDSVHKQQHGKKLSMTDDDSDSHLKTSHKSKVSEEQRPSTSGAKRGRGRPKKESKSSSKPTKQLEDQAVVVPALLKARPKTGADVRRNEDALRAFNANHEDDLFRAVSSSQPTLAESDVPKASDILGELFDSDSEQNISLTSAKTPITSYISRKPGVNDDDEEEEGSRESAPQFGIQPDNHAFVARKAKEARKTHRLMKTKFQTPLDIPMNKEKTKKSLLKQTALVSRFSQELLANEEEKESDVDEYFSDMDGTSSINNPPSGLMSLLGRAK